MMIHIKIKKNYNIQYNVQYNTILKNTIHGNPLWLDSNAHSKVSLADRPTDSVS